MDILVLRMVRGEINYYIQIDMFRFKFVDQKLRNILSKWIEDLVQEVKNKIFRRKKKRRIMSMKVKNN